MANEKPNPNNSRPANDDALAALHNMQNGEPETPEPDNSNEIQEMSASGFVGMLAKGQQSEGDSVDLTPAGDQSSDSPLPMPKPQPVANVPAKGPGQQRRDEIAEAQEIRVAAPRPIPPRAAMPIRRGPSVPHWYHVVTPVAYTMSCLLMLIGLWSIAAVMGFGPGAFNWHPEYPDEPRQWMEFMPFLMLACLPVAIALGLAGMYMNRRITAAERAKG